MRTLIYRRWTEAPFDDIFHETVAKATKGEDGVRDIYIRSDGFIEIRYDDFDKDYWVPMSQVLAYRTMED